MPIDFGTSYEILYKFVVGDKVTVNKKTGTIIARDFDRSGSKYQVMFERSVKWHRQNEIELDES